MTRKTKKLLTLFTAILGLCLCVLVFAACGNTANSPADDNAGNTTVSTADAASGNETSAAPASNVKSVTFMVQNSETGEWEQLGATVTPSADGTVSAPTAPEKDYFTFANWYLDTAFANVFSGRDVEGEIRVYARYIPVEVNIHVDGEALGARNFIDVLDGYSDPLKSNLVFDGWYTDPGCTVAYTSEVDTADVYGRFVAEITFDNGHEVVYTTRVVPGAAMEEPPFAEVCKWYMDPNNVYYYDGNTELDFSKGNVSFRQNTTVTVKWCTPMAYFALNASTNKYSVAQLSNKISLADSRNLPAVSFLSKMKREVTKTDADGNKYTELETIEVEDVTYSAAATQQFKLETMIYDEGIKVIRGGTNGEYQLKKLVIPSTVKIIDNAFLGSVGFDVELPEGVEVIINSFKFNDGHKVVIPASVKSIAMAQPCYDFSKNANFRMESDGLIYRVNDARGKILVGGAANALHNGVVEVPEGVAGIQVGTFCNMAIESLILPASWKFVSYNPNVLEYPFYYPISGGSFYRYNCYLCCADGMNAAAMAIFNYLGPAAGMHPNTEGTVYIKQAAVPEDDSINETTFTNWETKYTTAKNAPYVKFIGAVNAGESISITVTANDYILGSSTVTVLEGVSGQTFSQSWLIQSVPALKQVGVDLLIRSVTQFGEDYDYSVAPDSNLYLDVEFSYYAEGYTYTINDADLTATITGFNRTTAYRWNADASDYLVEIPETITSKGKTYTVVAIAPHAFDASDAYADSSDRIDLNYDNITAVVIPKTVKTIGEYAFYKAANLTTVFMSAGDLEKIGRSAFEGISATKLALPVRNLKEVGPYAFKIPTLQGFDSVEGEEDISLTIAGETSTTTKINPNLKQGDFVIWGAGGWAGGSALVQFVSTSTEYQYANLAARNEAGDPTVPITVYDVRLISLVARPAINSGFVAFGTSTRRSSLGIQDSIVRWEIMEGSVSYLDSYWNINSKNFKKNTALLFVAVSKIHKNAFTDISANVLNKIQNYDAANTSLSDKWLTAEQISAIASKDYDFSAADAIFEDGWFDGHLTTDADYEEVMAFMATVVRYNSIAY